MHLADQVNQFIQRMRPWVLAQRTDQESPEQFYSVCSLGIEMFRALTVMLKPILPALAEDVETFLNIFQPKWSTIDHPLPTGHRIGSYTRLMAWVDAKQLDALFDIPATLPAQEKETVTSLAPAPQPSPATVAAGTSTIFSDDFAKIDLRVALIANAETVEGTDKLMKLTLEPWRRNAHGLRRHQVGLRARTTEGPPDGDGPPDLAPRKMRFGLSEGMILSAGFDGGALALLDVDRGALPGMPVR